MANSDGGSSHRFADRRNMLNVLNMRGRTQFKHFQEYSAFLANRVVSGILVFGNSERCGLMKVPGRTAPGAVGSPAACITMFEETTSRPRNGKGNFPGLPNTIRRGSHKIRALSRDRARDPPSPFPRFPFRTNGASARADVDQLRCTMS